MYFPSRGEHRNDFKGGVVTHHQVSGSAGLDVMEAQVCADRATLRMLTCTFVTDSSSAECIYYNHTFSPTTF